MKRIEYMCSYCGKKQSEVNLQADLNLENVPEKMAINRICGRKIVYLISIL